MLVKYLITRPSAALFLNLIEEFPLESNGHLKEIQLESKRKLDGHLKD